MSIFRKLGKEKMGYEENNNIIYAVDFPINYYPSSLVALKKNAEPLSVEWVYSTAERKKATPT